MKWQPIETAPTDGTRILLRGRNGKIADGHYGQPDGFANPKRFVWPYIHANPTHWRPLPEPPESAAAPAQADRDAPVDSPEPEQCRWFQDGTDSDTWQTGCGSYFMINDGTPSENNMAHCAYCGRHLVEYSWEEEQEGGE